MKVNKLSSVRTQLPYEYYSLPYCKPKKIIDSAENLGELLRGDRIENSVYEVRMLEDQQCKVSCKIDALDKTQAKQFQEKVTFDYRVNMILDNLPVAMVKMESNEDTMVKTYDRGFPVGYKEGGDQQSQYFVNNHLRLTILYHSDPDSGLSRIVGFEVEPFSVKHTYAFWDDSDTNLQTCTPSRGVYVSHSMEPQPIAEGEEIVFSYDVLFEASDIRWASRWDTYLLMRDEQIHWFSIVNSSMIVLFLSGMVAMIILRTLHKDISNYNQLDNIEEAQEETGWKLVHGDVFRPPTQPTLFCVFVGTGVQLLGMVVITMMFALLGFLSPANRGGLMSATLMLYAFMGVLGGYYSARLYKTFKLPNWKAMSFKTALLFPGIVFGIFFILDMLIWGERSSGAVPVGTLVALCFLWFGISVPLVFLGSYFGVKKAPFDEPVRTNRIPRQIPQQDWYMNPIFSTIIGGVLPFGAVFIELFFILSSMWLHQFYYMFGFLFIVFLILIVTCAEISIVLCYFQLCNEDYRWWWRSYLSSGSSSVYLFIYSISYFFTRLEMTKPVSGILYFAYMAIVSGAYFMLTGTIGFLASYWFVNKIYSAVKID